MLQIINQNGQTLELPNDVSIPVERNNMLFNSSEALFQDIVYSFDAPLSPANKLFIKYGHLVDALNDVYAVKVQAFIGGQILFDGVLTYSIKSNKIQATLKPNFASVAIKAANSSLNQIDFGDQPAEMSAAILSALMRETVETPDNYGYIFVPLWNTRLGEGKNPLSTSYPYVNYYTGYVFNPFNVVDFTGFPVPLVNSQNTPFPKLLAVLQAIANVLGYSKITGTWKDSDEAKTTYSHNVRALPESSTYDMIPFGLMLPNITIADYLKAVRLRFDLSFDFDNAKSEFKIESFDTALKQPVIDLTSYIEEVSEINIPAQKGCQINLKVEERDTAWNSGTEEEPIYIPNYDLLIGDAKDKIEINAGTLRSHTLGLNKSIASETTYLETTTENKQYNDLNNFALRFFKYDGFIETSPGNFWPQSSPLDVSLQKAKFYAFLNSAKQYRLKANIPSNVITQLSSTSVISFISKEGTYVKALVEKVAYDLKNQQQFLKTDITCRSLSYQENNTPILRDNFAILGAANFKLIDYKSNRKGILPVITVRVGVSEYLTLTTAFNTDPCDAYGVGGQSQPCYAPAGETPTFFFELTFRITQGIPKHVRILAKKALFTLQLDGSYMASLNYVATPLNGLSYFIVY